MGTSMSHRSPDMSGPGGTAGMQVARPQVAAALATALQRTNVVQRAVSTAGAALVADLTISDQLGQLSTVLRVVLRRAESQAMEKLGVGLHPGAARRLELRCGHSVIIVHGDGWSLVGRTPGVLLYLLDVAPGLVIDRSRAEGAGDLVTGLTDRLG